MGTVLALIGLVVAFIGGIWLIVAAFQESVVWGLLTLFISPAGLIFAIMHWERGGKPLMLQVGGLVVMILGSLLSAPPPPV
jgi:hypothetical protein